MKYAVDTSVLIDLLREHPPAVELFERLVEEEATLVSSYVIRTEVLSGMRRGEERDTRAMLDTIEWLPVGESESEAAGALGRRYLPANPGIDTPDLLLAEVAERQGAELLTTNIKHFRELLPGIRAPYRS
ncbi:MAG: type II toxin-antitoxin system VapC family toxin [Chloroflexi bacterium]|nr:MAG: type II toxin-antitoxin system VapC family toxin [Chloroflexota bacterium]TMG54142.1 MAG: type II toxin-antitoxin system VapC family toxin [Chloroflexota bacterium]